MTNITDTYANTWAYMQEELTHFCLLYRECNEQRLYKHIKRLFDAEVIARDTTLPTCAAVQENRHTVQRVLRSANKQETFYLAMFLQRIMLGGNRKGFAYDILQSIQYVQCFYNNVA